MTVHKRTKKILFSLCCVLFGGIQVILFSVNGSNITSQKVEPESVTTVTRFNDLLNFSQNLNDERPVINTFFSPLPASISFQSTGATVENHIELLRAWKKAWERNGWNARILTMNDVKQHPNYISIKERIEETDMVNKRYNEICFYRWFAMVVVGGGWLADYDVFPLNFPPDEGKVLPNGGTFTGFQKAVPCLMSGSVEEWDRVSKLLLDAMQVQGGQVTDQYVLQSLIFNDESSNTVGIFYEIGSHIPRPTENGFPYISGGARGDIDCEAIEYARAFHVSHRLAKLAADKYMYPLEGDFRGNGAIQHRAEATKMFLKQYSEQCSSEGH